MLTSRAPWMRRYRGAALAAFFLAAGCDAVLGIDEFPADDGGSDSAAGAFDGAGPQRDGTVAADGSSDAIAEAGDSSVTDAGDASVADALGDAVARDGGDAGDGGPPDPVVSISVGGSEACAITASGALYCWGPGPVGDGTSLPRWKATHITTLSIPAGQGVTGVCVGGAHACALVGDLALANGTVFCWGNNDYGQLGTGSLADGGALVLAPVAGAPFGGSGASGPNVACGAYHTYIGASAANGPLLYWGSNSYGELGHAPGTGGDVPVSSSVVSEANPAPNESFASGTPLGPMALGNEFTCGVFNNRVLCWGNNASNQLDSLDAGSFSPSPVTSLTNISSVAAGAKHACALDSSGKVTCWGDDSSGQLGTNGPVSGGDVLSDASAVGVSVPLLGSGTYVAAGGSSTCAALGSGTDASVACWGANEHGQLGHDPSTDPQQSCPGNDGPCNPGWNATPPVAIAATALAVGPTAACALKGDGAVWCWGSASLVGNGVAAPDASTVQFTAVQVVGLPPP